MDGGHRDIRKTKRPARCLAHVRMIILFLLVAPLLPTVPGFVLSVRRGWAEQRGQEKDSRANCKSKASEPLGSCSTREWVGRTQKEGLRLPLGCFHLLAIIKKKKKKKAALISENQPTFLRAIPVLNSQGLPQWPLPDPSWRLPVSPASLFWVSDPRLLTSSELAKGDGDQRSHPGALPSSPGSLSSPGLPFLCCLFPLTPASLELL